MPATLSETFLPWTGEPAWVVYGVHTQLQQSLGSLADYLPGEITLYGSRDCDPSGAEPLIAGITEHLRREIPARLDRCHQFVELGLLSNEEVHRFLTARRHLQPWAIYESADGGLGPLGSHTHRGVIPCSSMPNHGVAWSHHPGEPLKLLLATARKPGQPWDWDSDIGHESSHAAFAPLPLFVQPRHLQPAAISATALGEMEPGQIARMIYLYSELAVVAVRGEPRTTHTGLPVEEVAELMQLLALSHRIFPSLGFDRALARCEQSNGVIDVNHGTAIFEITAPILRLLPSLQSILTDDQPPSLARLQSLMQRNPML
jgi:hypothetical protein